MLYDNWWFDIVATTRDRMDHELLTGYQKKISTIVLPIYDKKRDLDMLPDIVCCREPRAEILKTTHDDIAHLFVWEDFLKHKWLVQDFWELYQGVRFAPFYGNSEKQGNTFIHKYMEAISQTALKSELFRQKQQYLSTSDDDNSINDEDLQSIFLRKISDVGIYSQYEKIRALVPHIDAISTNLMRTLEHEWRDINLWPDAFAKGMQLQDPRLN